MIWLTKTLYIGEVKIAADFYWANDNWPKELDHDTSNGQSTCKHLSKTQSTSSSDRVIVSIATTSQKIFDWNGRRLILFIRHIGWKGSEGWLKSNCYDCVTQGFRDKVFTYNKSQEVDEA